MRLIALFKSNSSSSSSSRVFFLHICHMSYLMFADDDFVDTSGDVKTVADYYADVATEE